MPTRSYELFFAFVATLRKNQPGYPVLHVRTTQHTSQPSDRCHCKLPEFPFVHGPTRRARFGPWNLASLLRSEVSFSLMLTFVLSSKLFGRTVEIKKLAPLGLLYPIDPYRRRSWPTSVGVGGFGGRRQDSPVGPVGRCVGRTSTRGVWRFCFC